MSVTRDFAVRCVKVMGISTCVDDCVGVERRGAGEGCGDPSLSGGGGGGETRTVGRREAGGLKGFALIGERVVMKDWATRKQPRNI
jgi:hypothetical protein